MADTTDMADATRGVASTDVDGTRGVDPQTYRAVLGRFVTGVTVITTLAPRQGADEPQPWGTTVNSFTAVSLEPPLVLVSIGRERSIHPIIARTHRFAVNILGENSQQVSDCFAGAPSALPREAFCNAAYALGECGLPILDEAIAYVGCEVEQVIPAGDHTLYISRVVEAGTRDDPGWPLLFFRRRYLRIERAATAEILGKTER
jgi:3-hydroxy-9,10-secoandrosta-1,3,5(10)-triene-9,17-dione monooxygenase reductase component